MDKLINIAVNGSHLRMDSSKGGVQGEVNATKLRITFDPGWDGLAKTITFRDALGNNPVQTLLTADNLENIAKSARAYICSIPGEALTEGGWFEFIIEGADNNKKVRSVEGKLYAEAAFSTEGAATPEEVTPSQAEQLQSQIDNLLGDIQELVVMAQETREGIAQDVQAAIDSKADAEAAAQEASESKEAAASSASSAEEAATKATQKANAAEEKSTSAELAALRAEDAMSFADASKESAEAAASEAKTSEQNAKASESNAEAYARAAAQSASEAKASAQSAANSQQAAANAEAAAEAAASEAEQFKIGAATRAQEVQANLQLSHDNMKRAENAVLNIEALLAGYITVSKTDIEAGVTALPNGRLYAYYTE